jgi:hypothetical protein
MAPGNGCEYASRSQTVRLAAGKLDLGVWQNPNKLGALHLTVEDFRGTSKMSDAIPFNF